MIGTDTVGTSCFMGIVPLYVIKDGIAYRDSKDITCDEIFAHVAGGGALCTTSAVSQSEYEDFFEKQLEGYDGLVHVNLSSEMSSCQSSRRSCSVSGASARSRTVTVFGVFVPS